MTEARKQRKGRFSGWTFRRAVTLSLVLHVAGVFVAVVLAHADFEPPEEDRIPIQLFADIAPMPIDIPPEPKKVETPKFTPEVADPLKKPEKKFEPKPPEPKLEEKPPVKPPEKKPEPKQETQKLGAVEPTVVPKKAPERPTVGEDNMIQVEGPPFEFAWYLKQVRRKISSKWAAPDGSLQPGQETKSRVFFRIERGGRVVDVRLEDESGVFLFDQSVLRALEKASPMPPLPNDYEGETLGLHVWFVDEL